jgi:two-component system sensor kinase FixL
MRKWFHLIGNCSNGTAPVRGGAAVINRDSQNPLRVGRRPRLGTGAMPTGSAPTRPAAAVDPNDGSGPRERATPLPEREALLRAIVETSPDGLITIDEDAIIQSFNPAAERMFACAAGEVIGRNVDCLMPSPYREEHDGYINRYLRTGEKRIIGIGREVLGQRKDGTIFPLELAVGEVQAQGRRIFAGFVRDVSARRRAEERLRELQSELIHVTRLSAMGEMASALAHELNQPLTAIMNYAQAARRLIDADDDERRAALVSLLEKTSQQASRAGQIIHRLRQFIAKGETERTLDDVNAVVEEAAALALIGTVGRGITVRRVFAPDLPPLLIDKIQIHQVITNLIRNSVDALSAVERRQILIQTRRASSHQVEIAVADNGPGLEPEVAARLFQPFVTTKPGGMGIGLSICRSIVEAHGGKLWASANPGGGTVFSISLPVSADSAA